MFQTLKTIRSKLKSKFRTRRIRPATPENAPATPESAPATPESAPATPESAPATPESAPISPTLIRSLSLSPRTKSNRSKAATKLQTTFKNKSAVAEECALCLAKMLYVKDQATLATCGHTFHRACINKIMENGNTTCPLCRREFTNDDIITPKEYKMLVNQKLNRPHTLNKTTRIFDEAMKKCVLAYRDYITANKKNQTAHAKYTEAIYELFEIEKPPIWKHASRKRYNTDIKRQNQIIEELFQQNKIAENERMKYLMKFKSMCKIAAPFTSQSRINFNPDNYHEFNEFIQSNYSRRFPNHLRKVTTRLNGIPYKFNDS
jgi:hypothetical protein